MRLHKHHVRLKHTHQTSSKLLVSMLGKAAASCVKSVRPCWFAFANGRARAPIPTTDKASLLESGNREAIAASAEVNTADPCWKSHDCRAWGRAGRECVLVAAGVAVVAGRVTAVVGIAVFVMGVAVVGVIVVVVAVTVVVGAEGIVAGVVEEGTAAGLGASVGISIGNMMFPKIDGDEGVGTSSCSKAGLGEGGAAAAVATGGGGGVATAGARGGGTTAAARGEGTTRAGGVTTGGAGGLGWMAVWNCWRVSGGTLRI